MKAFSALGRALAIGAVLAASLVLVSPSRAADKGAPGKAVEDTVRPYWTTCFLEAGGNGRALVEASGGTTRSTSIVAGFGCNYEVPGLSIAAGRPIVVGGFARGGFGLADWNSAGASVSFDQPMTIGARLGVGLGGSNLLYLTAGHTWAKYGAHNLDGMSLGFGLETSLLRSLSLAVEYGFDDLGDRAQSHGVSVMLRHRF